MPAGGSQPGVHACLTLITHLIYTCVHPLFCRDGHLLLLEYFEPRPLLLAQPGMCARLVSYYRKSDDDDDRYEALVEESRAFKEAHQVGWLGPGQRCPLRQGWWWCEEGAQPKCTAAFDRIFTTTSQTQSANPPPVNNTMIIALTQPPPPPPRHCNPPSPHTQPLRRCSNRSTV